MPPEWVADVTGAFARVKGELDSRRRSGIKSDEALEILRPGLQRIGYTVETGKKKVDKIRRPVLFGEEGKPIVSYEVDAFHSDLGIVVEVEAGRGAANNADYRDLIRASLMVDANVLVLAMMLSYKSGSTVTKSYDKTRKSLDAIFKSDRLKLPLDGVLLVGY